MTNRYITADQAALNTNNGDNTFVARDVTMSDGIAMFGNGGGDQTVTIYTARCLAASTTTTARRPATIRYSSAPQAR